MALSLVGTDSNSNNTANLTVTWPATDPDDVALLFLSRSTADTNVTPSGFTVDPDSPVDTSGSHRMYLYYKVCDGAESGTIAAGVPTLGAAGRQAALLVVVRGADTAAPYTIERFDATVSGLTHDAPAITIPVADCGIVTLVANRDSGSTGGNNAATPPTGFTTDQESTPITGIGSGGSFISTATDGLATARAASTVVDPGVWTFTDSGNPASGSGLATANAVVYTIAVAPPAAPAEGPGGPWFPSPLAEMPYAEKRAPWEFRPFQPPIPMQVWSTPPQITSADIPLTDTGTADDALTAAAAVPLTDTGAGVDNLSITTTLSLADTATADDALTVAASTSLSDTAAANDALTVAADVALADTATADDSLDVLSDAIPPLGAPFLSPFAELPFAAPAPWEGGLNKGVVVLEVWTSPPTPATLISLSDTGTGTDSMSVAAAVPLADTGTAVDSLTVSATLTLADTGSGLDFMAAGVPISLTDTGTAVDSLSITAVTVALVETATASDQLTIAVAVSLTDTGAGSDVMAVAIPKALSDTGTASDNLSIAVAVSLTDTGLAVEAISSPSFPSPLVFDASRVTTGHQTSRGSTGDEHFRVSTGSEGTRVSTGSEHFRVSTGHQTSRIVPTQEG